MQYNLITFLKSSFPLEQESSMSLTLRLQKYRKQGQYSKLVVVIQ